MLGVIVAVIARNRRAGGDGDGGSAAVFHDRSL
jgi:hypothetical protein